MGRERQDKFPPETREIPDSADSNGVANSDLDPIHASKSNRQPFIDREYRNRASTLSSLSAARTDSAPSERANTGTIWLIEATRHPWRGGQSRWPYRRSRCSVPSVDDCPQGRMTPRPRRAATNAGPHPGGFVSFREVCPPRSNLRRCAVCGIRPPSLESDRCPSNPIDLCRTRSPPVRRKRHPFAAF